MRWARTEQVRAAAILRCLEGAPQDVASIASALGCHPNTVRRHLARLLDDGLIVEHAARTGRPGRPGQLYGAAPAPASPLLGLARRLGREAGRDEGLVGDSATDAVGAISVAHGLPATIDGDDVVVRDCPLGEGPATATLCALHLGLAEGAAQVHEATVALERHAATCRFHVSGRV